MCYFVELLGSNFFVALIFFFRAPVHLFLGPQPPHRAHTQNTHTTHTRTHTHTHGVQILKENLSIVAHYEKVLLYLLSELLFPSNNLVYF